jgi:endonuclease YncB( thermonuclease family)
MSESATRELLHAPVAFALAAALLITPLVAGPAAAAPSPAEAPAGTDAVSGTARVLDGDTIDIGGIRVRLEGIDAPELGQTCSARDGISWSCGAAAANHLERLVGTRTVLCASTGHDKYGRTLGICRAGGLEINAEMVRTGLAWAFVKYSTIYVSAEAEARKTGAGIWQAANEPAWVYRERKWAGASSEAPEGCAIKGNISGNGNIYHMPWSPWYKRVKVDTARGERWFCTEADAEAAGWRPAMAH